MFLLDSSLTVAIEFVLRCIAWARFNLILKQRACLFQHTDNASVIDWQMWRSISCLFREPAILDDVIICKRLRVGLLFVSVK